VRRLLVGESVEVAEHDRRAVSLGEPIDFLVELGTGIHSCPLVFRSCGHQSTSPFVSATPASGRFCLAGDPQCHAMQPAREGLPLLDRACLSGEDQEGGLASVLGVMLPAKCLPADQEHQGGMPFHQAGEGGLRDVAMVRDEARE
jgi:hypothetical protein